MHQILRDIRAVAGVTGVAIIVKNDGRVERMFPAAFTEQHTAELLKLVNSAYTRLRGFGRLSLRFERVVTHLFNQPEYLLFVTVLPDVEETLFETVVKSKFAAISRVLLRTASASGGPARDVRTVGQSSVRVDQVIETLFDACNGVTQTLGPIIGLAKAATVWRHVRDQAEMANESLSALEIDPVGRLSIRKGRILASTAANLETLATMIVALFKSVGTAGANAEEAFYALAEPHRSLLEHHGFYHFFDAAINSSGYRRTRKANAAR